MFSNEDVNHNKVLFVFSDIMKSKSNPDILKMAAAAAKRSERTLRSKVSVKVTTGSTSHLTVTLSSL